MEFPLAGLGSLVFLAFIGLWVVSLVVWVLAIVEVAGLPDPQFRAAGTDKTLWVLVVVFTGIIGALIWRFVKRDEVLAAAGRPLNAPPGWYPEPGTGAWRWWDGYHWTQAVHLPPPPGV